MSPIYLRHSRPDSDVPEAPQRWPEGLHRPLGYECATDVPELTATDRELFLLTT